VIDIHTFNNLILYTCWQRRRFYSCDILNVNQSISLFIRMLGAKSIEVTNNGDGPVFVGHAAELLFC
jgi:zona occludens toxin (predicted ATPase)